MMMMRTLVLFPLLAGTGLCRAQCTQQVTHTFGLQMVAGTAVDVSYFGLHQNFSDCGMGSGPYLCGDDADGGYIISFAPPVDSLMLNFSALHLSPDYGEVMRVFVNGAHYAIPEAGTEVNVCNDELAVLTPEGDVGASLMGSSGWNGTVIPGPISTLMVQDSILLGDPGGAFFSLFICPSPSTGIAAPESAGHAVYPNPAHVQVSIMDRIGSTVSIIDARGRTVRAPERISRAVHSIATEGLAPGHYWLRFDSEHGVDVQPLVRAPR